MKKALLILSALLIVGGGCSSAPTDEITTPKVTPTTVNTAPAVTTTKTNTPKTKVDVGLDVKTSVQILPAEEKITK